MSGIVLRVFRICGIAVWTRRCAAGRSPRRTAGCPLAPPPAAAAAPPPAARLRASSAAAGFAPAFPVWRGNGPLPFRNRLPRRCGRLCRSRQADRFLPVLRVSAAQSADACFAAGADLRGAVWASANEAKSAAVKDGRQFPSCAAARPPRRKAGKKPDMAACVYAPQAQALRAGVSPTRAKPAGFPKGKWCASGGASDEISGRYAFSRL